MDLEPSGRPICRRGIIDLGHINVDWPIVSAPDCFSSTCSISILLTKHIPLEIHAATAIETTRMPSQKLRSYLVHLNRHGLARHNGAFSRHAALPIASHSIARYVGDWVISCWQANTSGLVSTQLVKDVMDLSGATYLIDTINPEVLERSVSSDLLY